MLSNSAENRVSPPSIEFTADGSQAIEPLQPVIEITADGSATLRSPLCGDTYHSFRGAVGEATHVYIEQGFRHRLRALEKAVGTKNVPLRVLEMGFGTGLNAWLTLVEAQRAGVEVDYTAVEIHPVAIEVARTLGYTTDERFMALHTAPWEMWSEPSEGFRLRKVQADFAGINNFGSFDVIYYDAFAPDTQPELWTGELFGRVFAATAAGGVLVTYSAKGDVRRALQKAGFEVEKTGGALGKRHMLRATK